MWDWVRKTGKRAKTATTPGAALIDERERLRGRTSLFYKTRRYPIYYCGVTKCGSTFLKNLIYALDFDVEHPDGEDLHGSETGLLRAQPDDIDAMLASPYMFAVVRDPVGRFLSVYFDKIYGTGPRSFPKLRTYLSQKIGLNLSPDLDVEGHQENCRRFADWIELNLQKETDEPVNYHWKLQTSRLRRLRGFPVRYLTLDGLDWQLPQLMQVAIPDLSERMMAISARNTSRKPKSLDAVVTPELRAQLEHIYAPDLRLYQRTQARWRPNAPHLLQGSGVLAQPLRRGWIRGWRSESGAFVTGSPHIARDMQHQVADFPFHTTPNTTVLIEDPNARMLEAYAEIFFAEGSVVRTRFRRSGGIAPAPDSPLEAHKDAFAFFLSFIARQMRLGAYATPAWCRPQSQTIARPARAAGARLKVAQHPKSAVGHLPQELIDEAVEAKIASMYPDDLTLYRTALRSEHS